MKKTLADYDRDTPFKNTRVLSPQHIPQDIQYREDELDELAEYVFAAPANGQEPENMFIRGPSGTGKTLCVKYWLEQAQQQYDQYRFYYANCQAIGSPTELMLKLNQDLAGQSLKRRKDVGFYTRKLLRNTPEKHLVIVIDEIDSIMNGNRSKISGDNILYNLLRPHELEHFEDPERSVSVVAISNKVDIKESLGEGTESSFGITWMSFKPYDKKKLFHILKDRCTGENSALRDFEGRDSILESISEYVAELDGDARTAISILRNAGKVAERHDRKHIDLDDVDKAMYLVQKEEVMNDIEELPETARLTLLSLLLVHAAEKKRTRKNIKAAYDQLVDEKEIPVEKCSKKQVGRHLDDMDKRNIVSKGVDHDARGRPIRYVPDFEGEVLRMTTRELLKQFNRRSESMQFFDEDVPNPVKAAAKGLTQ